MNSKNLKTANRLPVLRTERGRRLVEKLNDVIFGLGDKADKLSLGNLEASGMFSNEQADGIREFAGQASAALERELLHVLRREIEVRGKDYKFTKMEASVLVDEAWDNVFRGLNSKPLGGGSDGK